MIPAPVPVAAWGRSDTIVLREEDPNAPIRGRILSMMQERWDSDTVSTIKLKSIYRVDLPGKVHRRFDFALQANDGCTVVTTYYGGRAACDIANDSDPTPCNLESYAVYDAIRSAFSQVIYGASSTWGKHGPGIYTFTNPALAHEEALLDSSHRKRADANFVLIQCRVVTGGNSAQGINPYARLADESGTVFCSQSMAIIPTHLLVYGTAATFGDPVSSAAAIGTSSRLVAVSPPRPEKTISQHPPLSPPRPSLPNRPTTPPVSQPALFSVPAVLRAPQPRSSMGEGPKPNTRATDSAVPPSRQYGPLGVYPLNDSYGIRPEVISNTKKKPDTDPESRATNLATSTSIAEIITIEAPRKPLAPTSPKPIPPVILDPVYLPLPPSTGPPASDTPVKKAATELDIRDTIHLPAHNDEIVQPPPRADDQGELISTYNAQEPANAPMPSSYVFTVPDVTVEKEVPHKFPPSKNPEPNEVKALLPPSQSDKVVPVDPSQCVTVKELAQPLDKDPPSVMAATSGPLVAEPAFPVGSPSCQAATSGKLTLCLLSMDFKALDFPYLLILLHAAPQPLDLQSGCCVIVTDDSSALHQNQAHTSLTIAGQAQDDPLIPMWLFQQPVASGAQTAGTNVGVTARFGDERANGFTNYVPSRGRSGGSIVSLVRKWANLRSDLRKGKRKD
ncbi:hypothetical protein FS837_003569 [Tulasnella sp. UAMH 9824]|nr:hypothetical protein FS837_003569 [Tulasnella sp. UAMH 9824]